MKAVTWQGVHDMRVDRVPDPELINPRDAIIRVTSTAICGSDLHPYDGKIPSMQKGDIMGHEFMGIVEETGPNVKNLKRGDRVVVPFGICCGNCYYCQNDLWSQCSNSNPNAPLVEAATGGFVPAGLFGYSHLYGGYAGGQAEYARVPFADVGPLKIESDIADEKVLFLTDIFPTGYQAAAQCGIRPGDTVAVFGCGPVGQFAMQSAYLLGAERVIAIDRFPDRLAMARDLSKAETVNYEEVDSVAETLKEMTGGEGPNHVIDAVGLEAHGTGIYDQVDRVKQFTKVQLDRATVLREAIMVCGKGGTVSVPGVYIGFIDKFPFGAAFSKGLTFKMGQTNTQKYLKPLLDMIEGGKIDPSQVITHRVNIDDAPEMYRTFRDKKDGCIKVVLKP